MNSRLPLRIRRQAFTLVELLTVIAIIAILMGLLFPALTIVKDQANKVSAKAALMGTVAAVKQYYTEYGKYPLTGQATNQDVTFGDSAANGKSNEQLYDILRNYPNGNRPASGSPDGNPRQIVFFEGKNATAAADGSNPKGGFTTTGNVKGAFYDPWGKQYNIVIDGDYDNKVTVPYSDFATALNTGSAGWSLGKDGQLGTKGDNKFKNNGKVSDDVITWQ